MNGFWRIQEDTNNVCANRESFVCGENDCEAEVSQAVDYEKESNRAECKNSEISCENGILNRCGEEILCKSNSCIELDCESESNDCVKSVCKPLENVSKMDKCHDVNDSQCVKIADNTHEQLQCVDGIWGRTNVCGDGCSVDAKTCKYCDEKENSKCDGREPLTCRDGRWVRQECQNGCLNGECKSPAQACPDACPDNCNPDGTCPVICPDQCQNGCTPDGACACLPDCPNGCDSMGKCNPSGEITCLEGTYRCTGNTLKCKKDDGSEGYHVVTKDMLSKETSCVLDYNDNYYCPSEIEIDSSLEDACKCKEKLGRCIKSNAYFCDKDSPLKLYEGCKDCITAPIDSIPGVTGGNCLCDENMYYCLKAGNVENKGYYL